MTSGGRRGQGGPTVGTTVTVPTGICLDAPEQTHYPALPCPALPCPVMICPDTRSPFLWPQDKWGTLCLDSGIWDTYSQTGWAGLLLYFCLNSNILKGSGAPSSVVTRGVICPTSLPHSSSSSSSSPPPLLSSSACSSKSPIDNGGRGEMREIGGVGGSGGGWSGVSTSLAWLDGCMMDSVGGGVL